MNLSNQLGDITQGQIPEVQDQYSKPMEMGSVDDVYDKAYGAMTSRLDPQWQQREQMKKVELANQGLAPGGEAYDNSMRELNQARNDAYQQATLGAISTMPQTYQLASSTYNQPLNILNALRTGAQIQNPTFQAPGMQSPTAGANYLGAAQAQGGYDQGLYNSQVGQQNAMTSGLFGLAGAGLGAYGMMNAAPMLSLSDRRLKSNIMRVGTHKLGIGIYEYDIFGKRERGVMADEVEQVMPEAVGDIGGGFKGVNYEMIDA
jgi:hypothetical protein